MFNCGCKCLSFEHSPTIAVNWAAVRDSRAYNICIYKFHWTNLNKPQQISIFKYVIAVNLQNY